MSSRSRVLAAIVLTAALMTAASAPASATITDNTVGCSTSVVIRPPGPGTVVYTITGLDEEAKAPRKGTALWTAATGIVTHDHSGRLALRAWLWDLRIASWGPSANAGGAGSRMGSRPLPGFLERLPRGTYRVHGFHEGREGRCEGSVAVELGGSPFGTVAGAVSVVGTFVTAGLLVLAARRRT